ncbi:MAG: DUF4058 family protein [Isosphaeraceae bacterium]
MPSPYPGMNPFLEEDDVWHDFHEKLMSAIAEALVAQARPNDVVKIDEHVYVHEHATDFSRRFLGRADVSVAGAKVTAERPVVAGVIEAPARVRVPALDVEWVAFVEIRDRKSRELVGMIEVPSPANKRPGPDREQYVAKRQQSLGSRAHLVEIDLLRGGTPMPLDDRPACAFSVLVRRVGERPEAGFWPIGLRDPLPRLPIPLREPDRDATLDLQDVLHRIHDASGYEDYMYPGSPQPPSSPEDRAWAEALAPPRLAGVRPPPSLSLKELGGSSSPAISFGRGSNVPRVSERRDGYAR